MKALSVRQPWAYAIAKLGKDVENRTWTTGHRGEIAIHAGIRWDGDHAYRKVCDLSGRHPLDVQVAEREMGAVVAVADLVDVCDVRGAAGSCGCGPWAMVDQFHWRLANAVPLAEPVPVKGHLWLWEMPPEVETAVRMQIAPPVQDMTPFCPWCKSRKPVGHDCPAGAVGCTERQADDLPCGGCRGCQQTMLDDLARRAEFEHGSPSDLNDPA